MGRLYLVYVIIDIKVDRVNLSFWGFFSSLIHFQARISGMMKDGVVSQETTFNTLLCNTLQILGHLKLTVFTWT